MQNFIFKFNEIRLKIRIEVEMEEKNDLWKEKFEKFATKIHIF